MPNLSQDTRQIDASALRTSSWSRAAFVFLALALLFFLTPQVTLPHGVAGPAEGAAVLVGIIACDLGAGLCVTAGLLCAWKGLRRSQGQIARAAWALNAALAYAGLTLALMSIVGGGRRGRFVAVLALVVLGAFGAAVTDRVLGPGRSRSLLERVFRTSGAGLVVRLFVALVLLVGLLLVEIW